MLSDHCEWLLLNPNSVIFHQFHCKNKLFIQWDDDMTHYVLDQHAEWIFIVLTHWNHSWWIDMDTSSWTWANQPLLLLIYTVCLAGRQNKTHTNTCIKNIVFGPSMLKPMVYRTRDENLNITQPVQFLPWLLRNCCDVFLNNIHFVVNTCI